MSWINLGEVFYITARRNGVQIARELLEDLRHQLDVDEVSPERVLAAAEIKAMHPMAFADAFAVATAQAYGAVLLTGDPEILKPGTGWLTEDLR
jgi:uncharacterized protein